MNTIIHTAYDFSVEIRAKVNGSAAIVHQESIEADLADLVDETLTAGVLAEKLPPAPDRIRCDVKPEWLCEPVVRRIEVELQADSGRRSGVYRRSFSSGRWSRRSLQRSQQLRADGAIPEDQIAYVLVLAAKRRGKDAVPAPELQPPRMVDQGLEELGVRRLADGGFAAERPILVNERVEKEIVEWTVESGTRETGGGLLGKIVRLPAAPPQAQSRIVTVLTTALPDARHAGGVAQFSYSAEALAEADQIARLRGLGESVLSAFHSHGWGTGCDECNQNEQCVVPQCTTVSVQDYEFIESLFAGKATLMPISGRKLGAAGRRPVLEIHAWQGGQMRPIAWRRYRD